LEEQELLEIPSGEEISRLLDEYSKASELERSLEEEKCALNI
jgi:hypothetical protein